MAQPLEEPREFLGEQKATLHAWLGREIQQVREGDRPLSVTRHTWHCQAGGYTGEWADSVSAGTSCVGFWTVEERGQLS